MEAAVLKAIATVQHVVCTFSQGTHVEERFEAFEHVAVAGTDMAHESMQAWAEASRASRSVHAAVDGARAALHKETAYEVAAVTTEGFPPASSARQMVATVSGDLAVRSSFSNSNEPDEGAGVAPAGRQGIPICAHIPKIA